MKNLIRSIPLLNSLAKFVYFTFVAPFKSFSGSENYWEKRYKAGGTSGAGSYDIFSKFKAEVLNQFVTDEKIETVIEFGCGDGNQLTLLDFPSYLGFDVSSEAISQCEQLFTDDKTKSFKLVADAENETAQLSLSLDVIYHLVEDDVFLNYMQRLFNASEKFVIIYSSNTDEQAKLQASHVKHRKFSTWIEGNTQWQLLRHIPNRYPYKGDEREGSFADFYIYQKQE